MLAGLLVFSSLLAASDPSLGRDFHLGHSGWNGLSRMAEVARGLGCPVESPGTLDWSKLDGQDILLFVHPETAIDDEAAFAYLGAGGRLLLADDYGQSQAVLRRLGIEREAGPLPAGTQLYRQNASLPVATRQRETAIARGTSELVGNHSAFFRSALPATYEFTVGTGLVIEGRLQHGRFIAMADSSLFINNMLELPGNRDFLVRLLVETCRVHRDRILLFSGRFSQRGMPPAVLEGAPLDGGGAESVEKWNRSASGTNLRVYELLRSRGNGVLGDAVLVSGLLFCLAALALLLRYLPTVSPTQDERFAQPPRPPETGLHASIVRYMLGAGQAVRWGYVYPATLLREEVLARLEPWLRQSPSAHSGSTALSPTTEELSRCIREVVSPRAGELCAELLVEFRRLDRKPSAGSSHPSSAHVSSKQLIRWHTLATQLFAELEQKKNRAAAPQ
ncbi:MAG: DUF4350 domain-containing protein [Myxococcales bacterium]|nr:DUF4350 domain-containing protein [Myxococcales bacterium]